MRKKCLLILLALLSAHISMAAPPEVNLSEPANFNLTSSSSINFSCNATDDQSVYSISLYFGHAGNLSLNSIRRMTGMDNDGNTTLLCHFDNSYVCENGKEGIGNETSFEDGMFLQGVLVNDTDTLKFNTSGIFDLEKGSVEMWVRIGFDPMSGYINGEGDLVYDNIFAGAGQYI